jgi:hypothetical protein
MCFMPRKWGKKIAPVTAVVSYCYCRDHSDRGVRLEKLIEPIAYFSVSRTVLWGTQVIPGKLFE